MLLPLKNVKRFSANIKILVGHSHWPLNKHSLSLATILTKNPEILFSHHFSSSKKLPKLFVDQWAPKTSWHLFTISCHLPISFFSFYSFSFCDFPLFFISKVNIFIWYWNCVAFIWQQTKRDEKNGIKENLLFFACIIISREEKESSMILTKNTSFMRCNRMDFIW